MAPRRNILSCRPHPDRDRYPLPALHVQAGHERSRHLVAHAQRAVPFRAPPASPPGHVFFHRRRPPMDQPRVAERDSLLSGLSGIWTGGTEIAHLPPAQYHFPFAALPLLSGEPELQGLGCRLLFCNLPGYGFFWTTHH